MKATIKKGVIECADKTFQELVHRIINPKIHEKYKKIKMMQSEILLMRTIFQEGAEVILLEMDDLQSPPPNTKGIITGIDDAGTVTVNWENGSRLGLIVWEDSFILQNNS